MSAVQARVVPRGAGRLRCAGHAIYASGGARGAARVSGIENAARESGHTCYSHFFSFPGPKR